MKLLSGTSNDKLANNIATVLDLPLTSIDIERFRDQEIFVKINENVRGEDIFLIPVSYTHLTLPTKRIV